MPTLHLLAENLGRVQAASCITSCSKERLEGALYCSRVGDKAAGGHKLQLLCCHGHLCQSPLTAVLKKPFRMTNVKRQPLFSVFESLL